MFRLRNLLLLAFVLTNASTLTGAQVQIYHGKRLCTGRTELERNLLNAVSRGNEPAVRQLLQKNAGGRMTDDCDNSILTYAILASDPSIVRLLIEAGAEVNAVGDSIYRVPLSRAVSISDRKDRYAVVKVLIEAGAKVDVGHPGTPLMESASKEDVRLVELLIASGADVNVQDERDASSAYSLAAELGHQKLKQILLAAGADPNVGVAKYRKVYGEQTFFQAAADGRVDVVEAMLGNGMATVNMTNAGKVTALMRAHDEIMADVLLKAGADMNLQDDRGFTALMWAAEIGRIDIVKKLIAMGADVNLRRKDGKALIDLVGEESEMEKLLIDAGASRQKSPK